MNTISITTSQNIELEYDLGSIGDRILGRLIDWVVVIAYIITIMALIGFSNLEQFLAGKVWLFLGLFLPIMFYDLVCEIILNGQSLGKKVMGIKVVSLSGEQPSFGQYLIRWLFRLVDFTFSSSLVALIMVAVSEKKQRLGDLIAGTVLVKTKPRTSFSETIYQPAPAVDYHVYYPEVVNLRDSDVQLIREVILNVYKSKNTMLALHVQQKIEQVLDIKSKHYEPLDFLRTVLADYNHLTSQI